jgi:hypothetical protein
MINNSTEQDLDLIGSINRKISRSSVLRLSPYLILGGGLFLANSSLELPYFLRGYLTLLEAQLGIFFLYFFLPKYHRTTPVEKNYEK